MSTCLFSKGKSCPLHPQWLRAGGDHPHCSCAAGVLAYCQQSDFVIQSTNRVAIAIAKLCKKSIILVFLDNLPVFEYQLLESLHLDINIEKVG